MHVSVHYLPQFVAETDLADRVVVVVDLLRASTTICQALASGAECVAPCVEVDETLTKANGYKRSTIVLGGERGGERIAGFDLGNSPTEYTPDQVFGRTVLFTTTNGTRALAHARLAKRVLIGAAVNRQALVETIVDQQQVEILCAGTGGNVTREDILAAGAIVDRLSPNIEKTNEWAAAALREWQELETTARALGRNVNDQFAEELRETPGGKNLLALGFEGDLLASAQLDTLPVVPELDRQTGTIRLP
ncbi:MAG: 2-phosphosulfolactate phosphatase [Pirellulales bacterium]|nr:2-phosphosulfolactate phosphatase [Pirellulales bacterium]